MFGIRCQPALATEASDPPGSVLPDVQNFLVDISPTVAYMFPEQQRRIMKKITNTLINLIPEVSAVLGALVILHLIGVIHVVS